MKFIVKLWKWSQERGGNGWFVTRLALLCAIVVGLAQTIMTPWMVAPMFSLGIVLFDGFGYGRTPLRYPGRVR